MPDPSRPPASLDAVVARATALRRALHAHPELAWQEQQTAATLRAALDEAGISWRAVADTGTVATFGAGREGRHLAFRGDIDGLPIHEQSGAAWSSRAPGRMHACGHDGHAATLMGLAWLLVGREDQLAGPVSLLFQPAEEGGHGAARMIEGGALDGVDAIFGWHNWPAIPFGQAVCPDGTVMAANGTFVIRVEGEGGHAAQPEAARNPVVAAAAITLALQQIVSGGVRPQHPHVLTVASIDAASAATVIPARATLEGTIRCARTQDRDALYARMATVVAGTAAAWGVRATLEPAPRYVATVNHPGPAAELRDALRGALGDGWHAAEVPVPIMASEDFSYYLQQVPGAFALVGSDDGTGRAHAVPCHSPHYDFNDRLILPVLRAFAAIAGLELG